MLWLVTFTLNAPILRVNLVFCEHDYNVVVHHPVFWAALRDIPINGPIVASALPMPVSYY